jgi:hypothetical protein
VARPKVNFRIFYSADKHRGVKVKKKKRAGAKQKGIRGYARSWQTNRVPLFSTRGLATEIEGNSIQK